METPNEKEIHLEFVTHHAASELRRHLMKAGKDDGAIQASN